MCCYQIVVAHVIRMAIVWISEESRLGTVEATLSRACFGDVVEASFTRKTSSGYWIEVLIAKVEIGAVFRVAVKPTFLTDEVRSSDTWSQEADL